MQRVGRSQVTRGPCDHEGVCGEFGSSAAQQREHAELVLMLAELRAGRRGSKTAPLGAGAFSGRGR